MTDSKAFGKMLTKYYKEKGFTQDSFANMINRSKSTLAEWESGTKTPNGKYALSIVNALNLSDTEATDLLALVGHSYPTLSSKQDIIVNEPRNVYRPTGIVIADTANRKLSRIRDNQIVMLREQLDHTKQSVDEISAKLNKEPAKQIGENSEIISEIHKLQEILQQVQIPSQSITAPVILPPPEDMEVRLVSSTSLERLEEYRSEVNKWYTIVGIFLGAILGIFINSVTGGNMTSQAWILVLTFLFFAVLTGFTGWNYQKRVNQVRSQILREPKTEIHKAKSTIANNNSSN